MNTFSGNPCQEYFTAEHNMLRKALREFVKKEITPFVDEWERAGEFPRELYKKMANL
ncbi:MAG: acyl-CoA dehydrogenase family protein, partial [Thermodesulfobacteriota bacterium]